MRSAKQGPQIISAWVIANALRVHRIWIVSTDTFVRGEPDNFFRVDKNSEDVIRTKRAAAAFESEVLDRLSVLKMKGAPTIGGNPDVVALPACDRRYRAGWGVDLVWLERICAVE